MNEHHEAEHEQRIVADILAFCQARAIPPGNMDINHEHERVTWQAVEQAFADKWGGDLSDLLDDHYIDIIRSMYTGISDGACPAEVTQ